MNSIISGGIAPFISKILSVLIVYLFFLFISRVYGAKSNGLFSTFLSLLTLLSVVSKLGFETLIVKRLAALKAKNEDYKVRGVYYQMAFLTMSVSVFLSVLVYFFNANLNVIFFEKEDVFHFGWLAISLPIFSLYSINTEALRGLKKMTFYSVLQNVTLYGATLLLLILLFNNPNYLSPIYAFCGGVIFVFILSVILLFKALPLSSQVEKESNKQLLSESLPMMLSSSFFYLMTTIDVLMISYFLPETETGIYATATKISNLNILFLFAINAIAAPKLAEFYSKKHTGALKAFTKETSRISTILSAPILLLILLFPNTLLSFFGDEFTAGSLSLIILGLGQFFNALSGSVMNVLNMTSKEKTAKNIIVFTTIFNLLANALLIPRYGILGASIATAASTILWNGLGVYFVYKYFNFVSITLPWQKAK